MSTSKADRILPPDRSSGGPPNQTEGFIRPEAKVLDERALVPEGNLIAPAPNQFTHELIRAQPFYFSGAQQGLEPDGELPAATRVVLLFYDGGAYCRVADEQGLYVETEYDGLRRLRQGTKRAGR